MNTNINEKINENLNAELDMEQLEDVNGGGVARGVLRTVGAAGAAFGYGAATAVCPALAAGTPYVAVGLTAWATAGYMKKGW